MRKSRPIRVFIADDHSVMREGLKAILTREPEIEVVGQAGNWLEAVELVPHCSPEIALLDLHMGGMEPAAGIKALHKKCPAAQIIIFSAFGTAEEVYQVFSAGARGYVLKGEAGSQDLLACIRTVFKGEMWLHPIVSAKLAERTAAPSLTPREIEVLRLMTVGKSNKEIGSSLDVTEGTVKVHVNHILSKLGVGGRIEAIVLAMRRGLVHLTEGLEGPMRRLISQESSAAAALRSPEPMSKGIGSVNSSSQLHTKK